MRRIETIGDATLYLGDCREILTQISSGHAVVTDPPYGIGFEYDNYSDTKENWFNLINEIVPVCRAKAGFVLMPACSQMRLKWWYENHPPDWIIAWHKGSPGHQSRIGFNDWEAHVCWGRPTVAMHDHFSTACGFDNNGHPCPKPIDYSMWLVSRAAQPGETVIDPFMGSGTTGVAALKLGRKFIGIEISEKYFDISAKRLDEIDRQSDFILSSKPKQTRMAL